MFGQHYPGSSYPGQAGVAATAYRLDCAAGSYAVTGTASAFLRALRLAAAVGTYAIAGSIAALKAARLVAVDAGAYSVTGAASALRFGYSLIATAGSYAVTGIAAALRRAARLLLSVGSYVITGRLSSLRRVTDTTVLVFVSGVDKTSSVRFGSMEIEDVLNDAPNRCTFTTGSDYAPAEGEVVIVTRGPDEALEFAGHVISVQQFYEGILANVAYHVTCIDYTWKLNRRLVTKRWTNHTATAIAHEIISGFTSGFTVANVEIGLPIIPDFRCDRETPSSALERLCAEIGGNFYIDYELDLHLFLTETTDAPADISDATLAATTARGLVHTGDLSQARTRVRGVGIGTSALENIASLDTLVPVEKADYFEAAGGSFAAPENVGAYTGRHLGGVSATVVGSVSGPSDAPSATVTPNQVGVLAGVYKYKVAFGNAQGETTPGPESSTVTCTAFAPPVAATASASGAIGPLVGVYLYVLTYVTALGETSAGSSFGRTATAVAAPGSASIGAGSTIGKLIGSYNYRITFVTPFGETAGGTVFSRTAIATSTPSAPSVSDVGSMGKLVGTYGYKVTIESADGESAASTAGSRTAAVRDGPGAPTCTATSIGPLLGTYHYKVSYVGPDGTEALGTASTSYTHSGSTASTPSAVGTAGGGLKGRARVAWRHHVYGESTWSDFDEYDGVTPITVTATGLPSGCSWVVFFTGPFSGGGEATAPYYRGSGEHTTTGAQNIDNEFGSLVSNALNTMGGNCSLSNIGTGVSGTVARRIYRTRVGGGSGGQYYLVGEIPDNSTTTFVDIVPDAALTILAPTSNTTGSQNSVTSIGTGPTGTIRRNIYRTEAGGSTYYFLRSLEDNSTTSFTDNAADGELDKGRVAPSSATSGDQHALTSIPTGPSGTTARKIYRTTAGGSIYYLLHTLPDNATTSYTDNKSDAELGAEAVPATSTAGGQAHSLTSIPTGPTGTLARRIYRTTAGGTSYQFVGELTDNVATTFTDNLADANLAHYVPLVNTAGANKVSLTGIPTGASAVTKRLLYRTEAGGSTFRYLATIEDNSTTTFIDNKADTELGREPLTQSTIGAIPGDTSLLLSSVTGWPSVGWLRAGSQLIRWTGLSGTSLTGIPGSRATTITRSGTTATATTTGAHGFATNDIVTIAGAVQSEYNGAHRITVTGATTFTYTVAGAPATPATGTITTSAAGAILASIQGGSGVVTAPFLAGVSGLTYTIEKGVPVRIYVVSNDTAAQTALAALEGGDGIHEATIDDPSIETVSQLTAACDAELDAYSTKLRSITFKSRDPLLRSGKTVTLSLGAPTNISGAFLIQRVISSEFDTAPELNPMRDVIAAPVLVSFRDVLRRGRARDVERIL